MTGYVTRSLADLSPNPDKPARRYEVSPSLGIDGYNFNVAFLEPGEGLAKSGFHYHEEQEEFFYVLEGRCRVELEEGSIDLDADEMILFEPETPQFIHNPFDERTKLVGIGYPPEAHHPSHTLRSAAEMLEEHGERADECG